MNRHNKIQLLQSEGYSILGHKNGNGAVYAILTKSLQALGKEYDCEFFMDLPNDLELDCIVYSADSRYHKGQKVTVKKGEFHFKNPEIDS